MQIYLFEGLGSNFSSLGRQHHSPQRYALKEDTVKKPLHHIIMIAMVPYLLLWVNRHAFGQPGILLGLSLD